MPPLLAWDVQQTNKQTDKETNKHNVLSMFCVCYLCFLNGASIHSFLLRSLISLISLWPLDPCTRQLNGEEHGSGTTQTRARARPHCLLMWFVAFFFLTSWNVVSCLYGNTNIGLIWWLSKFNESAFSIYWAATKCSYYYWSCLPVHYTSPGWDFSWLEFHLSALSSGIHSMFGEVIFLNQPRTWHFLSQIFLIRKLMRMVKNKKSSNG